MILQSFSLWFHPSLYLHAPILSYHPFRCCSHSLIHLLPLSVLLLLIHLLLIFYVSLRHVISLSISYLLPVPFCSFRFNNISTTVFPFWYPPLPASPRSIYEHIPRLHSLCLSLPYQDLPLLLSMHASLCVSALSPSLSGLSSHKGGCRGRDEPEMVNCLFLTAQRPH